MAWPYKLSTQLRIATHTHPHPLPLPRSPCECTHGRTATNVDTVRAAPMKLARMD